MSGWRRRDVLTAAGRLVLLASVAELAGCAEEEDAEPTPPAGLDDVTIESEVASGHRHELIVPGRDQSFPPTEVVSYLSSTDAGHRHTVFVSRTELEVVAFGGVAEVTSEPADGHVHRFVLTRRSGGGGVPVV